MFRKNRRTLKRRSMKYRGGATTVTPTASPSSSYSPSPSATPSGSPTPSLPKMDDITNILKNISTGPLKDIIGSQKGGRRKHRRTHKKKSKRSRKSRK